MSASTATTNGRVVDDLAPLGLTAEGADRKHARRLNTRLVAGVACVLAAFIGFLLFSASSTPRTRGVVVATQDLPAGARLRHADLAVAQAQLGDAQARASVAADALDGLEGQELLAPVSAQQILARGQLSTGRRPALQPGFVRMTVPVRPDTAVGGALRAGDLVTVLGTTDKGKPTAQTRPVVERVLVDQVGQSDSLASSSLGGANDANAAPTTLRPGRPIAWATLIVPEDRATSLSLARWNGDLELVQLPAGDAAPSAR